MADMKKGMSMDMSDMDMDEDMDEMGKGLMMPDAVHMRAADFMNMGHPRPIAYGKALAEHIKKMMELNAGEDGESEDSDYEASDK